MNFHTLKIFVTAAELGSFSQAGERLYLTQPAISKRIAALEQELATRLFDRADRCVRLTEAGRELLPRANRLLEEVRDIHRSINNLAGTVSGTLLMGTSHHIGLHRLPPVLRAFSRTHQEVRLDIRFLGSESVCDIVEHGEVELGIVTLPPNPSPHLSFHFLWHDPLHFVVSRDHPLAGVEAPTPRQLTRYPAVLPAPATYTRDILEQALREQNLPLLVGMSTNYLETLKMLAMTGLGWALLPATMLSDDLVSLKLPQLKLARRLGIVTHQKRTLSNAAKAMLEACREHARQAQNQTSNETKS
jgi:DNA-binding transcriptional LysR family regulator